MNLFDNFHLKLDHYKIIILLSSNIRKYLFSSFYKDRFDLDNYSGQHVMNIINSLGQPRSSTEPDYRLQTPLEFILTVRHIFVFYSAQD